MYSLLIIISLAVYQDVRSYKIKNSLIGIGLISGALINLLEVGLTKFYPFVIAMGLPILMLFPLFVFKVLGAGDIKLFSVIGCYLGIRPVFKIIIISFFMGGIISIIYLIHTKSFTKRYMHLISYISELKKGNKLVINKDKIDIKNIEIVPYYKKERDGREGIIHFSIAILLAVIVLF